jgi:hypothetical protein
MASIYGKELKRKNISGVTNKVKEEVASNDSKSKFVPESAFFIIHTLMDKTKPKRRRKRSATKVGDPKAGADVG